VPDGSRRGPFALDLRPGGGADGWASGFDRRRLRALRRGEIDPDLEVDLHGLRSGEAQRVVRSALAEAIATRSRCVLIVHGRGTRSESGAVLRAALPEWLAEEPHAAAILAFAAAEGRHHGATYVLLRRVR